MDRKIKLELGRTVAEEVAKEMGTVDSRSIRPALEARGLLGGDERWIGFIFRDRKFKKAGEVYVNSNPKLRRQYINVYALAAA